MRLFSIGHGARTLEDFLSTLKAAQVAHLADVRRFPGSRRHPHFGKEALAAALDSVEIAYSWHEGLGGRRKHLTSGSPHPAWRVDGFRGYAEYMDTSAFDAALQRLLVLARRDVVAFMCSETQYVQCHRRLIADALTVRGVEVVHLVSPSRAEPHRPPPFMRVEGTRLIYDGPVELDGQGTLGLG